MTVPPAPGPVPQPFLHDLVSCVKAPTVALSGADGQIRPSGAQGVLSHDRRVLSELWIDVDGHEPSPAGHGLRGAGHAQFTGLVRHLGDSGADPTVRLERHRFARPDGVAERLELVNDAREAIAATVRVHVAADFATAEAIKHDGAQRGGRAPSSSVADVVGWRDGDLTVTVTAPGAGVETHTTGAVLSWVVHLPAHTSWTADIEVAAAFTGGPPANAFGPADGAGWDAVAVAGRSDLARLAERSVEDLAALALSDPLDPSDTFLAAGSPWFFTLFGRDSLWAARFTLPLGTGLARGTLRTLARRQGRRHDPDTAEAPGKILHEVRIPAPGSWLPPVYFGTVDATALWICLLHDAWRWGLPGAAVAELLDPLEGALRWLTEEADPDGDGFLEYVDTGGRGLANQGWKDSGDSIQHPDGSIAAPPIALSEAQAYAHEAALAGAALLDAFDRPGSGPLREWAAALRERFAATFWVSDEKGRFPAIALDGAKQPVGTVTSNLGHLLGTGLLRPDEAAVVADRLGRPDLDAGYGLRTMTADATGFNPLGYHAGSIWPHDTAIAVRGLAADGFAGVAASLAGGLLRAAPDFAYRLPELFAGTDARAGEPVLAYPAACRPQAWSAATVVALLQAALGLTADVPGGTLRVAPHPAFADWFPLRVEGLRVAGHPLTVAVDASGRADVRTSAPLTVSVDAHFP
ncbi:amylo-alpha-1,6-glucosidase [Jiangella ureilytica]|uniref:Amylo-alpha-1,6-glucosidase n=1 Tax=Jiangella ureilytica TaxID=2530374 RepID=A0A4R4RNV8_9ACTN|nr:glycogen debranching N-terminal domain-containing protein [Jiangella ureilytica]TDC50809.1 amylo-alpha-1,6-glucosidase [Jiangella ureilytica]